MSLEQCEPLGERESEAEMLHRGKLGAESSFLRLLRSFGLQRTKKWTLTHLLSLKSANRWENERNFAVCISRICGSAYSIPMHRFYAGAPQKW